MHRIKYTVMKQDKGLNCNLKGEHKKTKNKTSMGPTTNINSCSEEVEDADHYFFNCPNYNNERDALLRATRDFCPLNIYTFLFGDENLTAEENTIIFTAVHTFIKDTRRFTN